MCLSESITCWQDNCIYCPLTFKLISLTKFFIHVQSKRVSTQILHYIEWVETWRITSYVPLDYFNNSSLLVKLKNFNSFNAYLLLSSPLTPQTFPNAPELRGFIILYLNAYRYQHYAYITAIQVESIFLSFIIALTQELHNNISQNVHGNCVYTRC